MITDIVRIFKSLADETRLRIIRIFLNGNYSVNEVLYVIGGKQANISHHLKVLQECELIVSKKEGAHVFYRLNDFDKEKNHEIINLIRQKEKEISFYQEDMKHLEAISKKRKKNAKEYFDTVGLDFDNVQAELFKDIYSVDEITKLFGNKVETILDIGCGTGRNLPLLSNYANKIIGIDYSPKMIQLSEHICKKNNLNYELKIGDVYQLPFHDKSINGIFVNMVFNHISEPLKAISEISRVISKNGKFIFIDLLSHQDETMRENYADLWLGFTEEEINTWLSKFEFNIKEKIIKSNKDKSKNVIIIVSEKI